MKFFNITIIALFFGGAMSLSASSKLDDLKDPVTEMPENIAKPNCLQFQNECKGSAVDIKKRDAYEHCVEKKLNSHCKRNYGRETQKGLYDSCINTQCGQQSVAIEDPRDALDRELKEEIVAERSSSAQSDQSTLGAEPINTKTVEKLPEQSRIDKPENRVIVVEKNSEKN